MDVLSNLVRGNSGAFDGRRTVFDLGTATTGTVTPEPGNGDLQKLIANGAFTLAAPTQEGFYILYVENDASAGAITLSGFDDTFGDTYDTTDNNRFEFVVVHAVVNGVAQKTLQITALQ